jgi:uncharacterized protein YcbK (DUF882 family)
MLRLGSLMFAFSLAILFRSPLALASATGPEGVESDESAAADAVPVTGPRQAKPPVADGSSSDAKSRKRKKVAGYAVPESKLRVEPPGAPSGRLKVVSLATHDEADVQIFNPDGSYNVEALHDIDHVLRCKRTDAEKPLEPRLYVILSHVYDHFGKPLEIVSGYRNQRRQTSFHYKGSASDIRIPGVQLKKIRDFADSLDAGGMGVGFYPRAGFVHIDVRPLPSYRWIDNARPNPNSIDKLPPRGWKRKKLQS